MHIKTLTLKNFRRFEEATFEFGPGFNLLVGENGAGKTSVLAALYISLDEIGTLPDGFKFLPTDDDVRLKSSVFKNKRRYDPCYPCKIVPEYFIEGVAYSDSIFKDSPIKYGKNRNVSNKYFERLRANIASSPQRTYPVFINFRVSRNSGKDNQKLELSDAMASKEARQDAFFNWSDAASTIYELKKWVFIKSFARFQNNNLVQIDKYNDELEFVTSALRGCVEKLERLVFGVDEGNLVIEWHDRDPTPFDTLSDGQRGLIAMVADIARRACLLNPHLEDKVLEETPGIVLIDELDLHLHPKWQRSIVKNLKKTFPKIQFIATTHSPQIIGECKTDEVDRVIRVTEAGGELVHNAFGKDSSAVLRSVMGAEDRDPVIAGLLDQLFTQIDAHDFDQAKATLAILRTEQAGHLYEIGEAEFALRQVENIHDEAAE